MTPKPASLLLLWLTLAVVAFALNLAWEYAECEAFFVHGSLPQTWLSLILATFGDVALTAVAYLVVAGAMRDLRWPLCRWTSRAWTIQVALAVILSALIEIHALRSGRWSYSAAAPLLPGTPISLVPMLQLVLLLPACFGLGRLMMLIQINVRRAG